MTDTIDFKVLIKKYSDEIDLINFDCDKDSQEYQKILKMDENISKLQEELVKIKNKKFKNKKI